MQLRKETMSVHPEDSRLAASGPRDVTLYTRPGCHLCDQAKSAIAPLSREFGAVLREVNIDADPALKERYGWDVPVIFIGQRKRRSIAWIWSSSGGSFKMPGQAEIISGTLV